MAPQDIHHPLKRNENFIDCSIRYNMIYSEGIKHVVEEFIKIAMSIESSKQLKIINKKDIKQLKFALMILVFSLGTLRTCTIS